MRKENIQRKDKAEKYNETGAAAFFFATLDIVICGMMWLLLLRILSRSLSRLSVTLFLHRNSSHEEAAADVFLFLSGKHKNSRNSASFEKKNI